MRYKNLSTKGSSIDLANGLLGGTLLSTSTVVGNMLKKTVPVKANCFK